MELARQWMVKNIWINTLEILTHFQPMFRFYNNWKHQKTENFL